MFIARLALAAGLCMAAVTAQAQSYNLRFATSTANQQEPTYKAIQNFAAYVKEKSDGRIRVTIFPGEQLGAQKKVNEMIMGGANMVNMTDYGQLGQFVPDLGIVAGPYVYGGMDDARKLFASDLFKGMTAKLEAQGIKVLMADGLFGVRHMIADRPIRHPRDLKDMTLRVPASPIMLETFRTLGARPTEITWGEVYNALQANVVTGAEAPFGSIVGSKLNEVRKVVSKTGHQIMFTAWVTSTSFFNGLPPDLQKVLLDAGKAASEELARTTPAADEAFAEQLRKEGITIVEDVDIAAFRAMTQPAYTAVRNLTPGLYEQVQAVMAAK